MIPEVHEENFKDTKKIDLENDYDIKKCAKWIDTQNLQKVCLQFPDNLLPDSVETAVSLERLINRKVYILGDTTCGSCCVDEIAAQHISADGIVHYGHACLNPTARLPVFHVLPKKDVDAIDFLNKFKATFKDHTKRIILFYDVLHAHQIEKIHEELSSIYKHVVFSSLNCSSNVEFIDRKDDSATVVLGRCFTLENGYSINDYEAIFLGVPGKTLTTLSMSIPTRKWYFYEANDIMEIEPMNTPWLKRRRYLVEKLKDAKVVGIVVATLGIKEYLKAIEMVKNVLKEKNKKSYILSVGKINPVKLANFLEIDAFVMIACPENEVFDSRDFLKPILMPYEVELAFNSSREFSMQYCMDFRQILPGGINYTEFKASTNSDVSLITGDLRITDKDAPCSEKMNALAINTPGTVVIGKAGAQFLQERSWKGVEQRLGKDDVRPAEIGRGGLPIHYENEPVSTENIKRNCNQ